MGLIRTGLVGAIGYFGYKKYKESQIDDNGVAFADGQPVGSTRNAGPGAMGDKPKGKWSKTDEEMDQTFPASDPPANY